MTETVLPKAQAIALLQKLAHDDGFRARYQAHPDRAMVEAGVPEAVVRALPASARKPLSKLASKGSFAAALSEVQADQACVNVCLTPPNISFGQ